MQHDDQAATGNRPRKGDDSRARGPHRRAGGCCQVNAEVARPEGLIRRIECAHHVHRSDRRRIAHRNSRRRRRERWRRRRCAETEQQCAANAEQRRFHRNTVAHRRMHRFVRRALVDSG
jgi:hypothetical protein